MENAMTDTPSERRRDRRRARPEEHRIVAARIRPGHDVSVVDVSAGGALVESERRLLPGSAVELHLWSACRSEIVRGQIIRCAVARLGGNAICYRGAIAFDHRLRWLLDEVLTGYAVPASETRQNLTSRADATQPLA
jgi:hypothetical protein